MVVYKRATPAGTSTGISGASRRKIQSSDERVLKPGIAGEADVLDPLQNRVTVLIDQ